MNFKWQFPIQIQLKLFQSTKQLNLSETYESIIKDVAPNDPDIKWESKNIALPIEKSFQIWSDLFVSQISPAVIKNTKTWEFKTFFPYTREARIEYAIISLATKELIWTDTDKENNKIFFLKTTYYQIQKEIIEAINKTENKNITCSNCPYNVTEIKEALEILKKTNIEVKSVEGNIKYQFNRIKDIYLDQKKVVIELWTLITNYISSWDYKVIDSSVIASKEYHILKLKTLLNIKFRYAQTWATYNPSLTYLIKAIWFKESSSKRKTLFRIKKLLESVVEIDRVEVEKKMEGRKFIEAYFSIYPSSYFVSTMIDNNKRTKRIENLLIDNTSWEVLLEPLERDFISSPEFKKAHTNYLMKKTKVFLEKKK